MKEKAAMSVMVTALVTMVVTGVIYGKSGNLWVGAVFMLALLALVVSLILGAAFHVYDHVKQRMAGEGKKSGAMEKAIAVIVLVGLAAWLMKPAEPKKPEEKPEEKPAAVSQAEPAKIASQAQPAAVPVAENCECATGGSCTGPRGGRYCIAEGGQKKYLK